MNGNEMGGQEKGCPEDGNATSCFILQFISFIIELKSLASFFYACRKLMNVPAIDEGRRKIGIIISLVGKDLRESELAVIKVDVIGKEKPKEEQGNKDDPTNSPFCQKIFDHVTF
jgi:hypothetical protein